MKPHHTVCFIVSLFKIRISHCVGMTIFSHLRLFRSLSLGALTCSQKLIGLYYFSCFCNLLGEKCYTHQTDRHFKFYISVTTRININSFGDLMNLRPLQNSGGAWYHLLITNRYYFSLFLSKCYFFFLFWKH